MHEKLSSRDKARRFIYRKRRLKKLEDINVPEIIMEAQKRLYDEALELVWEDPEAQRLLPFVEREIIIEEADYDEEY